MLPDAAHIQEKDFEFLQRRGKAGAQSEPLYTLARRLAVQDLMVGVPYRRITHLRKHLALEFLDAGHILGSASVDMRISEGREPPPGVLRRHRPERAARSFAIPTRLPGRIDTLIIEATYADRTTSRWPTRRSGWARPCAGSPRGGARC